MSIPNMQPSNVLARILDRVATVERTVQQLVAASGTLDNATIYKNGLWLLNLDSDGRMRFIDGQILLWDTYTDNPDTPGRIQVDPDAGINVMRLFPPFTDGNGLQTSITMQGRRQDLPGNIWFYTDGNMLLTSQDHEGNPTGSIGINTPQLLLYNLPSVGSPDYQLGYDVDGGQWSVCLITSAAKYKQDVASAVIDPDAVLAIEPVTFRDIASVERHGDDAKVHFGVIADQLHELGLGDLLVTYGEDGEVEAAKYDRIGLALIPVARRQQNQIEELERTVALQQSQIDDLTTRLEALEGKHA